jgi:hypothetical protein
MASKNTLSESVDEVAEEVTSVSTSTATVAATTPKRMGVVRYCQVRELARSWTAVMKNRYKSEVHTLEEWDELYEWVRNRKVRSI